MQRGNIDIPASTRFLQHGADTGGNAVETLESKRNEIDRIDSEMASLFAERMKCAETIAHIKKELGKPVYDAKRENAVLRTRREGYGDETTAGLYGEFIKETVALSKKAQKNALAADDEIFVSAGAEGYTVTLRNGALRELGGIIGTGCRTLIVTDDGVPEEYVTAASGSLGGCEVVTLERGETNKNEKSYFRIIEKLYERGFSRSDRIAALGGGVVGDIACFAAATYNRGIKFVNVPTTLLSQVDSSIGGKCGIDYRGGKNLLGAFYLPEAVVTDPELLATLDKRNFTNGMAEIIKIALTCDASLFEKLEKGVDRKDMTEVIRRAVSIKADITTRDPYDEGIRKVLNFGHTLGHAIETASGLDTLMHGECVALGMIPMCAPDVRERLLKTLKLYGLPTECDIDPASVAQAMERDKKKRGKTVTVVYAPEIGSYEFYDLPADGMSEKAKDMIAFLRRRK